MRVSRVVGKKENQSYGRQPVEDNQHQVCNVVELESCEPSQLECVEVIVDDGDEAGEEVRGNEHPKGDQGLLSDAIP